jgi:hypothetical protein
MYKIQYILLRRKIEIKGVKFEKHKKTYVQINEIDVIKGDL